MIGKLALFAALAGSAVGATVVLADDRAPVASDVPVIAATRPEAAPTPTPMPARDIHVLVQTPDPKGAQPWAVRRFTTTLSNRSLVDCFELGRLDGDRFGWVDATGTFEPVGAGSSEWTTICRAPAAQRALGVSAQRFTMLTQPAGGTLEPLESVTFGVAASAAARVVPSDEPALVPGPDGIVLRVVPGQSPPGPFAGVLEYRDGRRTRFNRIDPPRWKGERAIAGTETVAVRAPDPAGGEPWADRLAGRAREHLPVRARPRDRHAARACGALARHRLSGSRAAGRDLPRPGAHTDTGVSAAARRAQLEHRRR